MNPNSNCIADKTEILFTSSTTKINRSTTFVELEEFSEVTNHDHGYCKSLWNLSPYLENVVAYIAGFLVGKLKKSNICDICYKQLITTSCDESLLLKIKNRGKFIFPSKDVVAICKVAENIIRQNQTKLLTMNNCAEHLRIIILKNVASAFTN
ncbi:hypothetical protein ABEB36_014146 [Hypothenemus hampei]|uniref:Uncharacterized protein n=1 Tax=Hypothenemus hampei TaxID=57062 RepID=A0ABD1E3F8_HYPHA